MSSQGVSMIVATLAGLSGVTTMAQASRPEAPAHIAPSQREHWAPLGLPRLRSNPLPGERSVIKPERFQVEALDAPEAQPGATAERRGRFQLINLANKSVWQRPIRGGGASPVFVSIQLHAAVGTEIRVGEISVRVVASPLPNRTHLVFAEGDGVWRPLGTHYPLELFGDQILSPLPVLTIFRDPLSGTWSLYSNNKQLVHRNRLPPSVGHNKNAAVSAGEGGAWILGLVQSSDNPLVEDDNMNEIDDAFERETLGHVLPANADLTSQKELAEKWRAEPRDPRPPALLVDRPLPNRLEAGRRNPENIR